MSTEAAKTAKQFDDVPAGRYVAKASTWGFSTTKSSDKRILVRLRITEGPHEGRIVEYSGGLDGPGLEYTIKNLEAMGLQPDCDDIRAATLDRAVNVKVVHRPRDNGGVFVEVKYVDPIRGQEKLDEAFAQALIKRVRAQRSRGDATPEQIQGLGGDDPLDAFGGDAALYGGPPPVDIESLDSDDESIPI